MTAEEFVAAHAAWIAGVGTKPNGAEANLTWADLTRANLTQANLTWADLTRANLTWADLTRANLTQADLTRANLTQADLSQAMMVGAKLPPAPVIPDIHQTVYAAASRSGALDMSGWHGGNKCGTTHCRAGWVVALAGHEGLELEMQIGTSAAAALIYMASDPMLEQIPSWYESEEDALADMKRLAEGRCKEGFSPA